MSNAVFTPPRSRRLLSPRRWRLWVIVADVLILAGIWSIQHWPVLKLQDVVVDGPMAWQSVARDLVTVASDSNLLSIDHDALERRPDHPPPGIGAEDERLLRAEIVADPHDIHARLRIHRYMPVGSRTIVASVSPNAGSLVQAFGGVAGWKKFMPKKPVRKESGMKSVVMTVNVFITSFIRLFTTERYVSRALPTRSRRPSMMSYSRTR